MRRTLGVILTVNAAVFLLAFVFGILPAWPDIHSPTVIGEPLFELNGTEELSISNSIFTMWVIMAVLIGVSWLATRRLQEHPRGLQNVIELLVQGLANFVESVGGREALPFVPLFGTLFLFILLSNYIELLPLVGQPFHVGGREVEPFHSPTADYHTTLALAVVSWVFYQSIGIRRLGLGYFSKFVNFSGFRDGPLTGGIMLLLVGPIELFSELFRILTLTLRLWGNIFGGAVSLAVMSALLVVPAFALPFIGLELLVGLVQALIFSLLVLVYIVLAVESHGEEHEEQHHPAGQAVSHSPVVSHTQKEVAHA